MNWPFGTVGSDVPFLGPPFKPNDFSTWPSIQTDFETKNGFLCISNKICVYDILIRLSDNIGGSEPICNVQNMSSWLKCLWSNLDHQLVVMCDS